MATHYRGHFRQALINKINSMSGEVFSRADLSDDHSNKSQLRLNRALKAFIDDGLIIKISHGLYAKALTIDLQGKTTSVLRKPFESVAIEALNKIGVSWELGSDIQAYNRGETTQVPAVFTVRLHSRFRGKIAAEGRSVIFEENKHAR